MFDANFYQTMLFQRVTTECKERPNQTPVVRLHLADGTTLDICHIVHLNEKWMAVAYFRDTTICQDMDIAFVGYEMVTRVTLSLHHPNDRRIGFNVERSKEAVLV